MFVGDLGESSCTPYVHIPVLQPSIFEWSCIMLNKHRNLLAQISAFQFMRSRFINELVSVDTSCCK